MYKRIEYERIAAFWYNFLLKILYLIQQKTGPGRMENKGVEKTNRVKLNPTLSYWWAVTWRSLWSSLFTRYEMQIK